MKLGIRGHGVIDGKTGAAALVEALKNGGFDAVQLVCHKSIEGVEYAAGRLTAEKAAEIGCAFAGKVHIALLGAYFNPVHPDAAVVENGIAVFRDNIERAADIGAALVASETGSCQGDPWVYHPRNRAPETLDRVTAIFGELAARAAKHGVNIGVEGATGHVCHSVKALKRVLDGIGAENTRVVFDYFNFMDGGNADYLGILEEGLETFGNIHCFHIKDCVLDGSLRQVPVGRGGMDFERILRMIKQYDKDAVLILEGTEGADAVTSGAFLREVWEKV